MIFDNQERVDELTSALTDARQFRVREYRWCNMRFYLWFFYFLVSCLEIVP